MEAAQHIHCLTCERLRKALEAAEIDVQNAEVSLRVERRKYKALKNELDSQRKQAPEHALVKRLFEFWQEETGHIHAKLGEKREKALLARLRDGYSARQIAEAIKGAAVDPFVSPTGKKFDDLELVCRDEVKLEGFIARYQAWKAQHG